MSCALFSLENISNAVGILTPLVLLCWFYYSRRQTLAGAYYKEIDGIYAGYTGLPADMQPAIELSAGIIMNIRETDEGGYFKGEMDFRVNRTTIINNRPVPDAVRDGIQSFFGKMDFEGYRKKFRHPFKPNQNRKYGGKLYLVHRLDFDYKNYQIQDYLSAEYNIIHYREMGTMEFSLHKVYQQDWSALPNYFELHKKVGFDFEPYSSVKSDIFQGTSRSD